MGENDGLIAAYLFDGTGGGEKLQWSDLERQPEDSQVKWIHLDYRCEDSRQWLQEHSQLEPVVIDALLAEETRPRCAPLRQGLLLILRGVNSNPGADPEDMVAIRLWIDRNRIISTRKRRLLSVQGLIRDIDNGNGPENTADFVVNLIERLAERTGEVIEQVQEDADQLEERVMLSSTTTLRSELADLRRQAILMRRYLAPQREAVARLSAERVSWLNEESRLRLREVHDVITRYVEELDAVRERAAVVHEELAARLSEQLNQRMYLLSMVAALFLPLGFLTGLLGINVGGMPGAEDSDAFMWVSIGLAVIIAAQLFYFRWRHWF